MLAWLWIETKRRETERSESSDKLTQIDGKNSRHREKNIRRGKRLSNREGSSCVYFKVMLVVIRDDGDDSGASLEKCRNRVTALFRARFDRDEKLEHSELDGIKQVESSPSIA